MSFKDFAKKHLPPAHRSKPKETPKAKPKAKSGQWVDLWYSATNTFSTTSSGTLYTRRP